jgi:glyoxylase-like metal-dependent hydrolase (beta-lactamase superfamily II)
MSTEYEVLAVRCGTVTSPRSELFYRYHMYGESDAPQRMDYFFWVVRNEQRTILVDTGFDAAAGRRRGRTPLVSPVEALSGLGVDAGEVSLVIVSHFHYDHIGNLAAFPEAKISFQSREREFWDGPFAERLQIGHSVEKPELAHLRAANQEGRVDCVDGDAEVAPGVRVVLVGGHCPGQQLTVVETARGEVVIASDALHFYEEMERDMPFAVFTDLPEMYRGFDLLNKLQDDGAVIVAGHDPLVMDRFPAVGEPAGLAVQAA